MKPVFVMTDNVKRFVATMRQVENRIGTDSLALVYGRAGRGKSRTSRWYATQNDFVLVESLRDWSVLWMYQDILTAYGLPKENIPKRKKAAFDAIIDLASERRVPVILDEADLIGPRLLETVRDLCKISKVPWVLIGEEALPHMMNRDRRVWSRRCAVMEFQPLTTTDITGFAREAFELQVGADAADVIQKATGGDIRLIELTLSTAEILAKANSTKAISTDAARTAICQVIPEQKK
jgi:DNA transposition AAA+ family ATPase